MSQNSRAHAHKFTIYLLTYVLYIHKSYMLVVFPYGISNMFAYSMGNEELEMHED